MKRSAAWSSVWPGRSSPVVFLASDAARVVTGGTYDVTAGDSAHNAA
jgi:hypothetical protein